jgi:hypothetical protein
MDIDEDMSCVRFLPVVRLEATITGPCDELEVPEVLGPLLAAQRNEGVTCPIVQERRTDKSLYTLGVTRARLRTRSQMVKARCTNRELNAGVCPNLWRCGTASLTQ